MSTRANWILMVATLAAAAWGFTGCTAHSTADAGPAETVGTLAPSYNSIATAPLKHDAPPSLGFVAGSADDDGAEVATTVTRTADAGEPDAAPEVTGKVSHGF